MESRKMVMMNLFAGQQRRCRLKEQTFAHSEEGRGWEDLREQYWNIYITMCKIDKRVGSCCITQGAQLGALG